MDAAQRTAAAVVYFEQRALLDALVMAGGALASMPEHSPAWLLSAEPLRVRAEALSATDLASLQEATNDALAKFVRLVGQLGPRWDVDEVLLVLTQRETLAFAAYAASILQLPRIDDGSSHDDELVAFATSTAGNRMYRSAIRMIERNTRRVLLFDIDRLGLRVVWDAGR